MNVSRSSSILFGLLGSSLQSKTSHFEIGLCCVCIDRIFILFCFIIFVRLYPGRWVLLQIMHWCTRLQYGDTCYLMRGSSKKHWFHPFPNKQSLKWSLGGGALSGHQHTEDAARERPGSREQSHPLLLPSRCGNYMSKISSPAPSRSPVATAMKRRWNKKKLLFVHGSINPDYSERMLAPQVGVIRKRRDERASLWLHPRGARYRCGPSNDPQSESPSAGNLRDWRP